MGEERYFISTFLNNFRFFLVLLSVVGLPASFCVHTLRSPGGGERGREISEERRRTFFVFFVVFLLRSRPSFAGRSARGDGKNREEGLFMYSKDLICARWG